MDTKTIDSYLVVELFLLLLIGIGPKIALVPFLDITAGMDEATKGLVTRKMLNKVSERLDESRLLVTEKVFGFLLAALAVQLVLTGLDAVGVIHLTEH
jgi:small neutral amino acid transporter SnatA (MarC family)